jgi:DNA polymerase-3 subunit gamma/tau
VSYLVLARKYRPQSFDDLAGQGHVAQTLANAIATGRVAHAFLFTGVRGVGKTTSARLLAKCLNCVGADGQATGPTSKPCQVCAPCKEIAAGSDIDVQEIDGASYNGVEEVRRLQEGLAFRPARDRFKIYIVDEVHMLSNAAWNAFLKTLEEPPPHVKFIFATTEVHKVPVTILSRCQRYDFKLIGTQVIVERLRHVLAAESIGADDLAVQTLAREAAGSMRDAMSLLDQVIAFSGEKVTGDDVSRVLGVASRQVLHELAAALISGDAARAVTVVDEVSQQGFDLAHVAKDILRHLRDLVVAKVCGDDGRRLLDLADEEARDVYALAAKTDTDDLSRLFQGFSRGFDDIVRSGQPRTALEMTLVRLARRPALIPLDELLARLGDLERRLGGGGAPTPPRSGGPGSGHRGASSTPTSKGSSVSSVASVASPTWGASLPTQERTTTHGSLALAAPAPSPVIEVERAPSSPPPPVSAAPRPVPVPALTNVVPLKPAVEALPSSRPDPGVLRAILKRVGEVRPALQAVLEHAVPLEVSASRVTLLFESVEAHSFLGAQAQDPEAIAILTDAARAHFGTLTVVSVESGARPAGGGGATLAALDAQARRVASEAARQVVETHPLVAEVIRLFGAELREVRLPDGEE